MGKKNAKKLAPILPASDSELRPCRSSGVHLTYTDPSDERQRAPPTPRWGPSSFTEILPASDSELRPRRSSGVRLACTDPSGEQQRASSTPQQWGPPSLHRTFRRATASTVHAVVGFVSLTEILPASDSELCLHVFLVEAQRQDEQAEEYLASFDRDKPLYQDG